MMKKRAGRFLLLAIGMVVLAVGFIWLQHWLNRPLPIPLNTPEAQPIKDALTKSHHIESILYCDPKSDVNLLDEVFIDTPDYKPSKDNKVLIAKYLGDKAVQKAGYLTYIKAYHIWERSGDLYPRLSPDPTMEYLATVAPTPKPVRYCPEPLPQPELIFQSIAVRENRAFVVYENKRGSYRTDAILVRINGNWFIASSHDLAVNI